MGIFLALVHHPVLDRTGQVVTTALTNVDLHDLARSGRTYGVEQTYVVTPVTLQQRMVEEIVGHWTTGEGAGHDRRASAMQRLVAVPSIEAAKADIARRTGRAPELVATGAQMDATIGYADLRARLLRNDPEERPILLLFGTGWGLAPEAVAGTDLRLPPVDRAPERADAGGRYNHLSVRAAVAIILDRLLGNR